MATIQAILAGAAALAIGASPALGQNREPSPETVITGILERFAEDYAIDPMARDIRFGIEVDGMRWLVTSSMADGRRAVDLEPGFGKGELFYFTLDRETLNLLDQGVWNGLTAMGAATSADRTPLDILTTEAYQRPANYDAVTRRLIFHFWTRGTPEKVSFQQQSSRVVHGAPASVLYYDEGFRSAVYHVPAGLERDQAPTIAVPFPRMVIVIDGLAEGEIGGKAFTAEAGEMIFSPPNIPVTFWNGSGEQKLSFVWLMWGEGA